MNITNSLSSLRKLSNMKFGTYNLEYIAWYLKKKINEQTMLIYLT